MAHKAFVSSTFKDLKAHRAAVIEALRKSGVHVDPMEEWSSDADEPATFSQLRMAGCDLCVLLVARRRGHVADAAADPRSITQMEYDYARRHHMDVLPFLLDDAETEWPSECDDGAADPLLAVWRGELRSNHGVGFFTRDPLSVRQQVSGAVSRWLSRKHTQAHLDAYLRKLEEEFGVLRILSVPNYKDEDNRNIPIESLYVESAMSPHRLSPDGSAEGWNNLPSALDVFLKYPKLIVLGDPGSGKSTLVAWIARQFAVDALPDGRRCPWPTALGRNSLGPVLPLPFILRDLHVGKDVTWEGLCEAFFDRHLDLRHVELQRFLDDGLAIFLLDGLDEVSSVPARKALRAAVFDGMRRYPKCRWLLTSRLVGYDEIPFHRDEGPELESGPREIHLGLLGELRAELRHLAPFDDRRVDLFTHNWYELRETSKLRIERGAADLCGAIRRDPGTSSLSRLPYLLTLMALIHRVDARLPNGRALLYGKIAEAYLQTIDDFRNLQQRPEALATKKRWLARVGYEMQLRRGEQQEDQGAIVAPASDVCCWVAQAMLPRKAAETEAQEFVDYIARRTGLLLPRGEGVFGFVHLSFQEYFAACYLKQQIISPAWQGGHWQETLRRYANEKLWQETLLFLCELIANSDEAEWLGTVLECLFGADFAEVAPDRLKAEARAVLLARLTADSQSGLGAEDRRRAVEVCCRWEVTNQTREGPRIWRREPVVVVALFGSEEERYGDVCAALVEAARDANVRALNLANAPLQDPTPLAHLTELRSLSLTGTWVSNLEVLKRLTSLQSLSLNNTLVLDLEPLERLTGLKWLALDKTSVADLGPLKRLPRLRELRLSNTPVSDLRPLEQLTELTTLVLTDTLVSDLRPLKRLIGLMTLLLEGTLVSDIRSLANLGGLRALSLDNTQISDLRPLERLSALKWLSLRGTPLSADEISRFRVALPDCTVAT
jgi:internalin A